jgi:hypothetical protein
MAPLRRGRFASRICSSASSLPAGQPHCNRAATPIEAEHGYPALAAVRLRQVERGGGALASPVRRGWSGAGVDFSSGPQ